MTAVRDLRLPVGDDEPVGAVTARLHEPAVATGPGVFLTHGAGGDLDDAGLTALAAGLATAGHPVLRANLPYREAGAKRRPPRADRAVRGLRAALGAARQAVDADPWVVGGKSYGGRVASMAVADGTDVLGLVFYGYPLHPPGKQDRLRIDHWPAIDAPCLFLQGTRDPFCDLGLLEDNLHLLACPARLHVVEGGDHSLRVTGKASPDGRPHRPEAVCARLAAEVVAPWLAGL